MSAGSGARGTGRTDALVDRDADWAGLRVVVTGAAVSGFAAADALLERGATVSVLDGRDPEAEPETPGARDLLERVRILEALGAKVRLGPGAAAELPGRGEDVDLVVTSPGWRPDSPVLAGAQAAGVPVWGEAELAWRLRARGSRQQWLTLTGTNGKTTTVRMLEAVLTAAGLRALAAGNVGTPLVEAVLHPEPYAVLAVELSSFQLHAVHTISPLASACLNLAPDHLDWHGSLEAYAADKGRVYERTSVACVYNAADPATERMVRDADVVEGCRAVSFTLGVPGPSQLGLVEDVLADRAFVPERRTSAAELGTLADVAVAAGAPDRPPAPHQVANALAAAALARAAGVPPVAVRDGLRGVVPEPHRAHVVAESDGVTWVDDSKATNAHAADASLAAVPSVVWVAGGLAKGARFDDLVARHARRLRAAVLLGRDRALLAEALARHAPDVPVVEVDVPETAGMALGDEVMRRAVAAAGDLAQPGDAVLLAPACASMDQFRSYAERGNAFAAAVRARLAGEGA